MQKDCHYYGTFYMAYLAGFSQREAQIIAWAAQTVDEMNVDKVRELREIHSAGNKAFKKLFDVVTIEELGDNELDAARDANPYYWDYNLIMIRNIWVPFHFLPGMSTRKVANIYYDAWENINNGRAAYMGDDLADPKYDRRNKEDISLICDTSTKLGKQMIEWALDQFRYFWYGAESEDPDGALIALGICMHVLADTWSHKGFSGSYNQFVNNGHLSGGHEDRGVKFFRDNGGKIPRYNPAWTGHGSAGCNPDIPGNRYRYYPNYAKQELKVYNKEKFCNGFLQMYDSMRYIVRTIIEKKNVSFGLYENTLENILDLSRHENSTVHEKLKIINSNLFTNTYAESVRVDKWKKFLHEEEKLSIKDYDFGNGKPLQNNDYLLRFTVFAKMHRDNVMDYVRKNYGIYYNRLDVDKIFSDLLG